MFGLIFVCLAFTAEHCGRLPGSLWAAAGYLDRPPDLDGATRGCLVRGRDLEGATPGLPTRGSNPGTSRLRVRFRGGWTPSSSTLGFEWRLWTLETRASAFPFRGRDPSGHAPGFGARGSTLGMGTGPRGVGGPGLNLRRNPPVVDAFAIGTPVTGMPPPTVWVPFPLGMAVLRAFATEAVRPRSVSRLMTWRPSITCTANRHLTALALFAVPARGDPFDVPERDEAVCRIAAAQKLG